MRGSGAGCTLCLCCRNARRDGVTISGLLGRFGFWRWVHLSFSGNALPAGRGGSYLRDFIGFAGEIPEDLWLQQIGAESYIGVRMRNAQGRTLGHLAVLHQEPMEPSEEDIATLQIYAAPGCAESERRMESLCELPLLSGVRILGLLTFMSSKKGRLRASVALFFGAGGERGRRALDDCLAYEEVRPLGDELSARTIAELEQQQRHTIDALQEASKALDVSEERFRDLFDEAPIAYVHEPAEKQGTDLNNGHRAETPPWEPNRTLLSRNACSKPRTLLFQGAAFFSSISKKCLMLRYVPKQSTCP